MLNLIRRWGRPIYSRSANGGQSEGIQGLQPAGLVTQGSDIRKASDVRRLRTVRTSGRRRSSVDSALDVVGRTSERRRSSVDSALVGIVQRPDVRRASVVRRFGPGWHCTAAGRPEGVGRPCPGTRRTSGLGRSSDACSFSSLSSSSSTCLGSSPSWLLQVVVPWLISRCLITHRVSE